MKKRIEDTASIVKLILQDNEEARNSDDVLFANYIMFAGNKKGEDVSKISILNYLATHNELDIPSFESIARARRKIQELYPELRSSARIEALREVNEAEFREFSKKVIL